MVGLAGAGKTTLARELEAESGALRLTPDDWIDTLYGEDLPREKLDAVRQPIEDHAWFLADMTLRKGIDVILDFGFWGRSERDDYRARGEALGARVEIVYVEVSWEELVERLEKRNSALGPGEFYVGLEEARRNWDLFQVPTSDELEGQSS